MARQPIDARRLPNRGIWVRIVLYTAAGHVFAAFLFLLFELGKR
ncbi:MULTISPECIES: DUF6126 family protein [Kitasatospora]|uniref:Small hydrophobic protein n=1 Tax=Kitasatospora cystarginea TaxID=58350 RepID=A0ABN3E5G5_9ACTN